MDWTNVITIGIPVVLGVIVGFAVGFLLNRRVSRRILAQREAETQTLLADARKEAEEIRNRAAVEAKETWERERVKFEAQTAATRRELERREEKLADREVFINRREILLTQKEMDLIRKEREIAAREKLTRAKMERVDQLIEQENARLEKIAGMSLEEARRELLRNLENDARLEAAQMMREIKEEAKKRADLVVASIFVNPLQFGPNEDFSKYPRDFERDEKLLKSCETDYLFYPNAEEMYPEGFQSFVEVTEVTKNLCGASRPGHFRGVTTVVCKLFNAVNPDLAYFGFKDYQQYITIKRMVKDLNMDIEIVGVPIVRETDGLAMSSRNTYLSPDERRSALCLYKSINLAKELISKGEREAEKIIAAVIELIEKTPLTKIDYIKLCDPETLDYIEKGPIVKDILLALAVFVGSTRLIDNTILEVK